MTKKIVRNVLAGQINKHLILAEVAGPSPDECEQDERDYKCPKCGGDMRDEEHCKDVRDGMPVWRPTPEQLPCYNLESGVRWDVQSHGSLTVPFTYHRKHLRLDHQATVTIYVENVQAGMVLVNSWNRADNWKYWW